MPGKVVDYLLLSKKTNCTFISIHGTEATEFSLRELEDILEMSNIFQMDTARSFALLALGAMDLSPQCRFLLAKRHKLESWIQKAFRELIDTPPHLFSEADYEALGTRNIYHINRTRSLVQGRRLSIAYGPPEVIHDSSCEQPPEICSNVWKAAWWGGFARLYLHPFNDSSPAVVLKDLESALIQNVNHACHLNTVKFVTQRGVLTTEDAIINEAVEDVM